ncbi:hypothetical protein LY76DRAFT_595115, partial [Colletotrichum caudatum]
MQICANRDYTGLTFSPSFTFFHLFSPNILGALWQKHRLVSSVIAPNRNGPFAPGGYCVDSGRGTAYRVRYTDQERDYSDYLI